ncbi:MAG: AAA family ATPase [Bacteroidota bacterium]
MNLLVLFGPPAVGKMTVAQEIEKLSGYKVFHNHMTIDLVTHFFPHGHPSFRQLVDGFRKQILEAIAKSDLPGVTFTFVWALNESEDQDYIEALKELFVKEGGKVYFAELEASQATRIDRNKTENRLTHKPSKRSLEKSHANLLSLDSSYVMNTNEAFPFPLPDPFVKVKSDELTAAETAQRIVSSLTL